MQVIDLRSTPGVSPERWLQSTSLDDLDGIVALRFNASQYWLEGTPVVDLVVICDGSNYPDGPVAVARWNDDLSQTLASDGAVADCARRLEVPVFNLAKPVRLQPVHIPKPWGEEIWFTGIEARGVAGCGSETLQIPLPWLLAAFPERSCCGLGERLILLKILAPLPEEVRGDLYLELHQEKREVYVVTHVDRDAWPSGVGAIRFGFDPSKLESLGEEGFRREFLHAVQHYETVRRRIDELLDDGGDPAALPEDLVAQEAQLRGEMNAFTGMMPLRVGDVVKVPTLTPHSLQHGVRTVEFQTPVYERMILAFAQKVLTQNHWDTERAVEMMLLDTPPQPAPDVLRRESGGREERIVDFEDFEVRRIRLDGPSGMALPAFFEYALIMCVSGSVEVAGHLFTAEQACLLPGEVAGHQLLNCGASGPSICLLALPR